MADAEDAGTPQAGGDRQATPTRRSGASCRARAVFTKYLVIYRTLADPAYLDLSIDPDDGRWARCSPSPTRFDANYGRGGLARTMTSRGWLSTWSGLSSHAKLADTMPQVKVPTMLVHPTADTEIRIWQAKEIVDNAGAADKTYVEMKGAPHYLEGHRPEALAIVAEWLGEALSLRRCRASTAAGSVPSSCEPPRKGVKRPTAIDVRVRPSRGGPHGNNSNSVLRRSMDLRSICVNGGPWAPCHL